jgi:hypothetical protein
MPPLVSDADDLEAMVSILHDAIDGVVPDT